MLESLNVAAFLANNTALHVVIRKLEASDGTVCSNLRRHALHSSKKNGFCGFFNMLMESFLLFDDELSKILLNIALSHLHELFFSVGFAETRNLFEFFLSLNADAADLFFEIL